MTHFIPKWIAWEITSRCNLQCIHCRSNASGAHANKEFSTTQAFSFLKTLSTYVKPVIVLTGGEPLLRSDVFSIANYGTKLGFKMCLATNGTLIDTPLCRQIKEADIKMVSLSIDGSTPEMHDEFRQQHGAFEGTMKAIKHFEYENIPFLVNSSFTKRNQSDINNVYNLVKETAAKAWYMFLVVPTGRGQELLSEMIDSNDYEQILNWHYDVEQSENELLMRPTCAPHYYRIFRQRADLEGKKRKRRNLTFSTGGNKGCVCAQTIAFINVKGDVQPCSYFQSVAGNIFEEPFKKIWEESELFNKLRDFNNYKGRCGQCEYLKVCGGCRARAFIYQDDFLHDDPICSYIPLKLKKKDNSK